MIVMIAADFYSEYELYKTEDPEDLEKVTAAYVNGEDITPDPGKHELIGSQDNIFFDDAKAMTDKVIFLSDYEQEEENA